MDFTALKSIIDAHVSSYPDLSWQPEVFAALAERFSLIPLRTGVYANSAPEYVKAQVQAGNDLKAPTISKWNQFCYTKNNIVPSGDKVGICCGPASGVMVLDIDEIEDFRNFCAKYGFAESYNTFTVQTREGRYHYYFQYPTDQRAYKNRGKEKPSVGFDLRVAGGFVIAPGSIHPITRNPYLIVNTSDIQPAPEWLLNWSLYHSVYPSQNNQTQEIVPMSINTPQVNQFQMNNQQVAETFNMLPENIKQRLNSTPLVGNRSQEVMSLVNAMINANIPNEIIYTLIMNSPIGEVARQKGTGWINTTITSGQQFVTTNPKEKLYMPNELYNTMLGLEYFFEQRNKIYYAKIFTDNGTVTFYDVSDASFDGYIFNLQATKTNKTGTSNDMKVAKTRLADYIKNHAKPIQTIGRFGCIDKNLILNLARKDGECIEINTQGYRMIPRPQVIFEDCGNLMPIETITIGATGLSATNKLFDLLDINNKKDRHYLILTCLSFLFDNITTPFIIFYGEYGSGKTTLASAIKGIFDPVPEDQSGGVHLPEKVHDLAIVLNNEGVALIDNFTKLPKKIQTPLCQAFSNGYFAVRKMYKNRELEHIPLRCPVLMTSLDIPRELKDDLNSRMTFFKCEQRSSFIGDIELHKEFEKLYPAVRGELCWLASKCLAIIDNFKSVNLKRHADFDRLGQAYFAVIAENPENYRQVLKHRIYADSIALLKNDTILDKFVEMVKQHGYWAFTMEEVRTTLVHCLAGSGVYIPADAPAMGKFIIEHKKLIAGAGVEFFIGTKIGNSQAYLAATPEKLAEIAGPNAKAMLEANPGQIAVLHDAPPEQINTLLDEMLSEVTSPITAKSEVSGTVAAQQISPEVPNNISINPFTGQPFPPSSTQDAAVPVASIPSQTGTPDATSSARTEITADSLGISPSTFQEPSSIRSLEELSYMSDAVFYEKLKSGTLPVVTPSQNISSPTSGTTVAPMSEPVIKQKNPFAPPEKEPSEASQTQFLDAFADLAKKNRRESED